MPISNDGTTCLSCARRNVAEILKSARPRALEPPKIEALTHLIEENPGYQLHQAVQQVNVEVSPSEVAEFRFREDNLDLRIPVARMDFARWIAGIAKDRGRGQITSAALRRQIRRHRSGLPDGRHLICALAPPDIPKSIRRGTHSKRK